MFRQPSRSDYEKAVYEMSVLTETQKKTLIDNFEKIKPAMLAGIQQSMRICSEKGEASADAPFGPGPKAALLDALEQAEKLGFRTANIDNKIGYAEIGEGDEMVAVLGHLDVVPAGEGWNTDPYGAVIRDGILYGRGCLDDKGPIVGALYSLKAIVDSGIPLKRRIRVIMGTDEECGSACVAHYLATKQEMPVAGFTPDADFPAIFCEKGILRFELGCEIGGDGQALQLEGGVAANVVMPGLTLTAPASAELPAEAADAVQVQQKGDTVQYTFTGKSAHAMAPQLGINAGYLAADYFKGVKLSRDIDQIFGFVREKLNHEPDGKSLGIARTDEETGALTVNMGCMLRKGNMRVLTLDLRYPPVCNAEEIEEEIRKSAAEFGLRILEKEHAHPLYIPKDSALIKTLMGVYREMTGDQAEPIAIGGGTYAKAFPNMVAFGPLFPGDPDVIHQPNEWADLEKLLKSIEISMLAAAEMANGEI